ncbi:hypothetical protein GGQ80_003674 [Sphingomonas jinjuensis]|uniref:Uncharacterized protein n=1 Tax=Sphingomonas jinjuensis TaxID=535907 RepID=A0A840FDS0_9SPHN|nr:hypothetical protein [Sphingomonas jinjuensis]MBB4155749.1 hypothetical protein [Sphingomonas jinjuensis]
MSTPTYGGSFAWINLICRFFRHDVDPLSRPPPLTGSVEARAMLAAMAADNLSDMLDIGPLPLLNDEGVASTVFHEQVHYWQLLSSPLLQSLFITALQKIRLVVAMNGGTALSICGEVDFDDRPDLVTPRLANANTLLRPQFTSGDVRWQVEIVEDPPTSVAAVSCRQWEGGPEWPRFCAALGFGSAERRLVWADLEQLTEGHALGSEDRRARRAPRRLLEDAPPIEDVYLGLWELWCRRHGHRATEAALGDAFLVAVDLAMLGGRPGPLLELNHRNHFPGERFARLMTVSADLDLPALDHDDDVVRYQDRLAEAAGLPGVDGVLQTARIRLLRMLTFSLAPMLHLEVEDRRRAVERLLGDHLSQTQEDDAAAIVEAAMSEDQQLPVGAQVLATMYNALRHRSDNRAHFALPARHAATLEAGFPLPLVLMGGAYYFTRPAKDVRQPLTAYPDMLRQEIIQLFALIPCIEGESECGFVKSGAQCQYTLQGLGCARSARRPLSDAAAELRKRTGVATWCHRARCDLWTGLMPKEERAYWLARSSLG